MAILRNGRLRLPVVSRLVCAWAVFAVAAAGFSTYALITSDDQPTLARIELPPAPAIERLAPPLAAAEVIGSDSDRPDADDGPRIVRRADGVTLAAAPLLRDTAPGAEPFSIETGDDLAYEADETPQTQDVVITIDGAPARSPAEIALAASARPMRQSLDVKIPGPDDALLRPSEYGSLPKPGGDGRIAATFYARPHVNRENRPNVALVVGGLGLNRALTERAIDDLPPEVTLAFAPYAKDLEFWTKKAREAGHEIMIELPMENRAGAQGALGPAALLTTRTQAENMQRLDWLLSRFGGYFGATNYLGAKFATDPAAMRAVLARLKEAGVAYIDDTGAVARFEKKQAANFAVVNRIVAGGRNSDAVSADLEALEQIARRDGDALGKAYPVGDTLAEIVRWSEGLEERGFSLAPASAVLQERAKTG